MLTTWTVGPIISHEVNINLACRPKPISSIPAWVLGLDHSCNGFCFLFNEMVYSAKKKKKRWDAH
jgi:hypothetical protein